MRETFLTVRRNAFDVSLHRAEIENIAACFGAYLGQVGGSGGSSKHRALGAVGKALQRARVLRGEALLGYARRVHEQTTGSGLASACASLDDGLRRLDTLLLRPDVPSSALGAILERVEYATYYDVRRRFVEFQEAWQQFVRTNADRIGLRWEGDLIPWYSKKLVEKGDEWKNAMEDFRSSRAQQVPSLDPDDLEE